MATVEWRGKKFDAKTKAALVAVDKFVGADFPIQPTQGSYSTSVGASAGTHAGGGAVDLSVRELNRNQIEVLVFVLRAHGFAAWHRTPDEGDWPAHVHAIYAASTDLSAPARRQVESLRRGRNGLKGDGPDRHAGLRAPKP